MRKLICLAVVAVMVALPIFGFPIAVAAAENLSEAIESFSTVMKIEADQSLHITETIVYQTGNPKHGILRYIPIRYQREGRSFSLPPIRFRVTDERGTPIPFSRNNDGQNVRLKIGETDTTFTGQKTYVISYVVNDALASTPEGLRLYWDITGEGWSFPILTSSAAIIAPTATILNVACYSGAFGTNDQLCEARQTDSHQAEFIYPAVIEYGENFTVDVQFDGTSGFIVPTPFQKMLKQILRYWWLILLALPPFIAFGIWYRYGRDYMFVSYNPFDHSKRPEVQKPIFARISPVLVYEPLDISPGLAGAMLDESYDNRDLVADILDLARRKLIRIKQTEKKTLFKTADYEFHKLKDDAQLSLHQQLILDSLFASGKVIKLSELKGKFYTAIPKIHEAAFTELFAHTMFTRNPWEFKKNVGVILIVTVVILYVAWQSIAPFLFFVVPVIPITLWGLFDVIVGIIFITRLTQKTGKGFNYFMQARGLRETILRGKWREEIKEKHLFIEEILPFAVSLNVIDKLSRDMKDLGLEPPQYLGGSTAGFVNSGVFVNSFASDVAGSLAYNPSSSSSGGGGFGGGSSGGGGGGGGGGSW